MVPVINQLRAGFSFPVVAITKDWHKNPHCSFYESVVVEKDSPAPVHPSYDGDVSQSKPFDKVTLTAPNGKDEMLQILWPRHCVQESEGSEVHKDLVQQDDDLIVYKGTDPRIDSYSAFFDNYKLNKTELDDELKKLGVTHVIVTGLAFDVCVKYTALDAADLGYDVTVVEDACAGVTPAGIEKAKQNFKQKNIKLMSSEELIKSGLD